MPRIFDNITEQLLSALRDTLAVSERADFCVGYFNLRGWKRLCGLVDDFQGDTNCCRLLVGMHQSPHRELRSSLRLAGEQIPDNTTAKQLQRLMAQEFREQLSMGIPTDEDEAGLRRLAHQIRDGKLQVKLFLKHTLHAKLYLMFRQDPVNPIIGYLGSSNLTLSGLARQGELNVDVLDGDACQKLASWFEDRWNDRLCVDVSEELARIILEESWASEDVLSPYLIYLKIAYHLSQEARAGVTEFQIPSDFGNRLLTFQQAAVKIAARHLNRRGGVLLGDVVGLGKTLMGTALARIFEDDFGLETLIICPKNLVKMWESYHQQYRRRGRVLSSSLVRTRLSDMRRYRIVLIDESQNFRNREGKTYRVLHDYIHRNESKVILLSATPYNKSYLDLSNQLRLFVDESDDLDIRPEKLLRDIGEVQFSHDYQASPRSLAAFEKSPHSDDWRDLMRLYLVRRTRTFIKTNYAKIRPFGR